MSASIVTGAKVKDFLLQADDLSPGILPGIRTVPANENALSVLLNVKYGFVEFVTTQRSLMRTSNYLYSGTLLHSIDNDYLGENSFVTVPALQTQTQNVLTKCVSRLDITAPGPGTRSSIR